MFLLRAAEIFSSLRGGLTQLQISVFDFSYFSINFRISKVIEAHAQSIMKVKD